MKGIRRVTTNAKTKLKEEKEKNGKERK